MTASFATPAAPVLSADEMRAWDERAVSAHSVPERVLMDNAGRAVAAVLQRLHPEGRVVVVAGPV